MPDIKPVVSLLIRDLGRVEPRLYECLSIINDQLSEVTTKLERLELESMLEEVVEGVTDINSPIVEYIFTGSTVRLFWDEVGDALFYEIREGTVWKTASFRTRTVNLQVDLDPLPIGVTTFLIKSITADNRYSEKTTTIPVIVPSIPPVVVKVNVIDNIILFRWDPPQSAFTINFYEVSQNDNLIGNTRDTFFTRFETTSGEYTYKIIARDIYGNTSIDAQIVVGVNQPPDYVLQYDRVSTLDGTRVNILKTDNAIFGCVVNETWQEHFASRGWNTIQDQIDANYPYYIQPTGRTGSYEEVVDFGFIFNAVLVSINWNTTHIDPNNQVVVTVKLATSIDNITFEPFATGASQLITNARYLKIRLEFVSNNDRAGITLFELNTVVSVKREQDGGEVEALSTDTNGTPVTFSKDFKDIDSVTATVKDTEAFIPVVDFVDTPNPSGFEVYVFDRSGNRASKTVEWSARGVV